MSKGLQIAVGALLVALLLGWYGVTNLDAKATYRYYQTLEEFVAAGPQSGDRSLRVHAYVVDGSIVRDVDARQVRFAVQNDPPHAGGAPTGTLSVVYHSLDTPDLFRDGAEVVVEGSLARNGAEMTFVAENVLAKCPSKFQAMEEEARL